MHHAKTNHLDTCLHLRDRNHSIDRIISKTYHVLAGPLVLRTTPLGIQNDPLALGSTPFSHSMCIHYTPIKSKLRF